jgi:hypothetical protein
VAYLARFSRYQSVLREALSDDNIDDLFDATNVSIRMGNAIESAVENGLTEGATSLLDQVADFNPDIVFNLKNPRAVEYLTNYGVTRVSQIDETSKDILRGILQREMSHGTSYARMATLIRHQFADWSVKRARLIAITEIGNAYQQGNLIVGLDLKAAGLEMQKSWLTRGDDKVDSHCAGNAADGWIDVSKAHSSGAMVPLDHPRCRCVELYRRKPSENV